jgi:hypothetical protein
LLSFPELHIECFLLNDIWLSLNSNLEKLAPMTMTKEGGNTEASQDNKSVNLAPPFYRDLPQQV